MIYTVTFNPAIDYIAEINSINEEKINRAISEKVLAGGKAINVSIVLKNLGIESVALGFIAVFTGTEIKRQVENHGIKTDFVYLTNKFSRINLIIFFNIITTVILLKNCRNKKLKIININPKIIIGPIIILTKRLVMKKLKLIVLNKFAIIGAITICAEKLTDIASCT